MFFSRDYNKHDWEFMKEQISIYLQARTRLRELRMSVNKKDLKVNKEYTQLEDTINKIKTEFQFEQEEFPVNKDKFRSFFRNRCENITANEIFEFRNECLKNPLYAILFYEQYGNNQFFVDEEKNIAFNTIMRNCSFKEIYKFITKGYFSNNMDLRQIYNKYHKEIFQNSFDLKTYYTNVRLFCSWVNEKEIGLLVEKIIKSPSKEQITYVTYVLRALKSLLTIEQIETLESIKIMDKLTGGK